jgi:anti-sigma-K factor RskA
MSDPPIPTGGSMGGGEEADLAAADHVLGLDDAEARAGARARLATDPAFAAAVAAWEDRFAPLLDEVAPVPPPDALWARIAAGARLPPTIGGVSPSRRPRLWNSLGAWRIATAASLAAAVAALTVLVWRGPPPPPRPVPSTAAPAAATPAPAPAPAPVLVATLASPGGRTLFVATLDRARGVAIVAPVGRPPRGGRAPELWIIPAGGKPRAIGVFEGGRAAGRPLPGAAAGDAAGPAILAVSLEPPGGSPTGAPTGPVVATGPLTTL